MRRAAFPLALSALLIVPASAWSQEDPQPDAPPPPEQTDVKTERPDAVRSDSPLAIGGIDAAGVPTEEKQSKVEGMLAEQRRILARVSNLLKEARAAKDVVQLNCINEKLVQIKGLLKISENASVKMYEAISGAQEDTINHEFTKITVAHQRCVTLGAEAEQCVGEIAVYTGQTEVTVEIDEDIPENDPTLPPPVGPAPFFLQAKSRTV
jgi:hypothetical protein